MAKRFNSFASGVTRRTMSVTKSSSASLPGTGPVLVTVTLTVSASRSVMRALERVGVEYLKDVKDRPAPKGHCCFVLFVCF